MTGFIGTSLQLQPIITAHTLNCFWILLRMNCDCCLTNFYEDSLEFTNELPFITVREPHRDHRLQEFHYCSSWMCCLGNVHEPLPSKMCNSVSGSIIPAFRRCLPSRCLADVFSGLLSRKLVLASRCLAVDFSGFQVSCHTILTLSMLTVIS
jgi:hypothetical protein